MSHDICGPIRGAEEWDRTWTFQGWPRAAGTESTHTWLVCAGRPGEQSNTSGERVKQEICHIVSISIRYCKFCVQSSRSSRRAVCSQLSAATKLERPASGPRESESDAGRWRRRRSPPAEPLIGQEPPVLDSHWSSGPTLALALRRRRGQPRKVTSTASKYVRMMKGEKCNLLHNMYFNSSRISLEFHKSTIW